MAIRESREKLYTGRRGNKKEQYAELKKKTPQSNLNTGVE